MTHGKLKRKLFVSGLALLTLLVIGAEAPLFADRDAKATRSSGGGGSAQRMSSTSQSSSSSGRSASGTSRSAVPRSGSSARAVDTRQSKPASRSRRGGRGGHGYYPRHHHHLGLHFGYGGYWGWGSAYYYPYYYHPFYWGVPYYVPRRAYAEYRLGAFDLNVRPKKAEVYLDGQYIGTAGQYDGFPDHLWLEEGSYELIFFRPGLATERRVLSIYPGVVVDVRLRLQPGESVPPSELSNVDRSSGAVAEVRDAYEKQARKAPPASAELDTRAVPGRVRLSVSPQDASVYLDGRLLGSGEDLARLHAGLVVDAGSHLIEVVRPGYATERLEFAVEGGDEVELEVVLEAG